MVVKKYLPNSINKKTLAESVSIALHPVVFSLCVPFLVVYKESGSFWYSAKWMVLSALFLFLAFFLLFLFRKKEFFSDFDFRKKEQRGLFYLISAISAGLYFLTALFFKGIFFSLSIVALGIIVGCVVMEICNMFIKVSVHTAVATAFIITIGILYGLVSFFLVFWIVPVVIWARLFLKKHTRTELITGLLVGEFLTCFTFLLGKVLQ